jgi:hypothetical protein
LSWLSSSAWTGVSSFIHWRLWSHWTTLPGPGGGAGGPHRGGGPDEGDEEDRDHSEGGHRLPPPDVAESCERGKVDGVEDDLEEVRRADGDDHCEVVIEPDLGEGGAVDERRPDDEVELLGVVLDEERRADEQGGRECEADDLLAHADDAADGPVELWDRVDGADESERGDDVDGVGELIGVV